MGWKVLGFDSQLGQDSFPLQNTQTGSEGQPASYSVGTGESPSPRVKHLGHEADHSFPPIAYIDNEWSCNFYTSTLLCVHSHNCIFLYWHIKMWHNLDSHTAVMNQWQATYKRQLQTKTHTENIMPDTGPVTGCTPPQAYECKCYHTYGNVTISS